jgi:hypothetical protein
VAGDLPSPGVELNVAAGGPDLTDLPISITFPSGDVPQASTSVGSPNSSQSYASWYKSCQTAVTNYFDSQNDNPYNGDPGNYWFVVPIILSQSSDGNITKYIPVGHYDAGDDESSSFDDSQGFTTDDGLLRVRGGRSVRGLDEHV